MDYNLIFEETHKGYKATVRKQIVHGKMRLICYYRGKCTSSKFDGDESIKRAIETLKTLTKNYPVDEEKTIDDKKENKLNPDESSEDFKPIYTEPNMAFKGDLDDPNKLPVWNIDDKFDPKQSYTIGLFGQTKSGKTTALKYIFSKIAHQFDIILFFSNNECFDTYDYFKQNFMVKTWFYTDKKKKIKKEITYSKVVFYEEFQPDVIKTIHKWNKENNRYFKFLVVLDDCIDAKKSKELDKLFSIYRNAGISTIAGMQHYAYFNKGNRANMNYIFIFKQSPEGFNDIAEKFLLSFIPGGGVSKKKALLTTFLREATKDHKALLLDILNDWQLFQWKAELVQ